jgi:hypothetical protein
MKRSRTARTQEHLLHRNPTSTAIAPAYTNTKPRDTRAQTGQTDRQNLTAIAPAYTDTSPDTHQHRPNKQTDRPNLTAAAKIGAQLLSRQAHMRGALHASCSIASSPLSMQCMVQHTTSPGLRSKPHTAATCCNHPQLHLDPTCNTQTNT